MSAKVIIRYLLVSLVIIFLYSSPSVLVILMALKYIFCSIDKVPKVTSPVLVIHGTEDEVIDFSHGYNIYKSCPRAVDPLWVEVRFLFLLLLIFTAQV